MMKLSYILFVVLFFCGGVCLAQVQDEDDTTIDNNGELERILRQGNPDYSSKGKFTPATFQSTRIVNAQSIENTGKGVLDFRIAHRFGRINEGVKNLYGLDNAITKFAFDYGITDWLTVGIGRTSYEKEYDGFLKVKILRQRTDNAMPVSLSYAAGVSVRTMDVTNIPGFNYDLSDRLYYFNQLIVARKFSKRFSLQLMPTYIHYNLVSEALEPNDVLAMGAAGRLKISKRIALTAEYFYTIPGYRLEEYNNSVSVGMDLETGGHVFQLFLTNSAAISERVFIGETKADILKGDIHIGFNISRVFTVVRTKNTPTTKRQTW